MVLWAPVTVDPLHIGQTSTLSGLLVAAATDSIVSVTSARLTSIDTKVPEAVDAVFTFLSPDSILANTLACCLVTLSMLTGVRALAWVASSPACKAPVVGLASVAVDSLNAWLAHALSSEMVAPLCSLRVAFTFYTVFSVDCIAVEPVLTAFTLFTNGVALAEQAHTRCAVASHWVVDINVAIAVARLAITANNLRLSKVAWATLFTPISSVVRQTVANPFFWREHHIVDCIAGLSKVVLLQRASTRPAVV